MKNKKAYFLRPIFFVAAILLLLSFIFRAFHFSNIGFDSDFGRDCLFALRILKGKLTLLGPQASVGGFYLGPLYFYFIALVFLVFGLNPPVISFIFILMNVAALYLGFNLQKKYVSKTAAIIFLLFGVSQPLLVNASRGATHQPMLPLAAVFFITVYMIALKKQNFVWYLLSGLSFGLFFHIHLSALMFLPAFLGLVFFQSSGKWQERVRNLLATVSGLVLMVSPLIIFDLRHKLITSKAFLNYLLGSIKGDPISQNLTHWSTEEKFLKIISFLSPQFIPGITIALLILCGMYFANRKSSIFKNQYLTAVSVFFVTSTLLIFLYKGYLYDYYTVVYLTVFLLFASAFLSFIKPKLISVGIGVVIMGAFLQSLNYSPYFRTIPNIKPIVLSIEKDIDKTKPQSFTVFKDSVDGMTGLGYEYRFLLERDDYVPISEYSYNGADVLYVIGEQGEINPLKLRNWEISQFNGKSYENLDRIEIAQKTIYIYRVTR